MAFDLTLTGAAFAAGKYGQAMTAGSGVVSGIFPTGNVFSMSATFKTTSVGAPYITVIGQPSGGWIGIDSAGHAVLVVGSGGTAVILTSTAVVNDGVYHEVRIDASAAGCTMYIDGVVTNTSATTGLAANIQPAANSFGVRIFGSNGTQAFIGDCDEVALYSAIPTPQGQNYTPAKINPLTTGLVGLWRLDGTGVNTAGVTAAADSLSFTGPSTCTAGSASGNFTLSANGTISASVVVTPSDGSGGTFSPATVTLTTGATSATFTYTASSAGAKSISITNTGGLSNAGPFAVTSSAATASAVTMTGPTSGTVGAASSVFTVAANGVISGSVVITPNAGAGGGTFSPATVTISAASPTGTFTYTAASSGTKAISVTNGGGLSNPASISFVAAAAPMLVAVDNSNIFWSPYNWDLLQAGDLGVSAKCKQTTATGAYLKFSVTGTTVVSLALDATTLAGFAANTPRLMWSIDSGPAQFAQITAGASSLSLAAGLATGIVHTVQVWYFGSVSFQGTRWGSSGISPTNIVRIIGITIDSGATISAYPLIRSKRAIYFGDSITEGSWAISQAATPLGHGRSAAWDVCAGLGAEYGVVGYSSQGWEQAGSGSIPAFPSTWDSHSFGRSRSLTGIDYLFVMHAYNGTTTQATVQAWLSSARAAVGATTWIFIVGSPSGKNSSVQLAAVTAYLAANAGDTKVAFLDYSADMRTLDFDGTMTSGSYGSSDGIHPYEHANAIMAASTARLAQSAINATQPASFVIDLGGGVGITRLGELVEVS